VVAPVDGCITTWFEDRYDDHDDARTVAEWAAGKLGCPIVVAAVVENGDAEDAIRVEQFDPWDGVWSTLCPKLAAA
jgi:hypothetical protein